MATLSISPAARTLRQLNIGLLHSPDLYSQEGSEIGAAALTCIKTARKARHAGVGCRWLIWHMRQVADRLVARANIALCRICRHARSIRSGDAWSKAGWCWNTELVFRSPVQWRWIILAIGQTRSRFRPKGQRFWQNGIEAPPPSLRLKCSMFAWWTNSAADGAMAASAVLCVRRIKLLDIFSRGRTHAVEHGDQCRQLRTRS